MYIPSVDSLCTWLGWSCALINPLATFLKVSTSHAPPAVSCYAADSSANPQQAHEHPHPSKCRCLSTESCWPSQAEFDMLARQVSQPLVVPIPPASVCYPSSYSYSEEACAFARSSWYDGYWRANQSGATQHHNFQSYIAPNGSIEACFLNASITSTCSQGSIPAIGVDARSAKDIQAAVKFATNHNLRLVIKNTGYVY
jgi:hypothetical protein